MEFIPARDVSQFNLVNINDIKEAWNLHRDYVNNYLQFMLVDPEEVRLSDLKDRGFVTFKKYEINKRLCDPSASDKWFTLLIKGAMIEVIENTTTTNISHFIYQLDKQCNREPRGIDPDIYDRFDTFKCGIESGTIVRHFGTLKGAEAYVREPKNKARNIKKRADFRASNKEFLRGMMFGFTHENQNRGLVCPLDGSKIEGIYTFNENTNELVTSDCYEIHHAKYDQLGSFYKSTSPSSYLNNDEYVNFNHNVIEEFLGCITLSQSSHTRVHHTHKVDGIDNWLKRHKEGRCIFIPYHWRSEENYMATLHFLSEKCSNFNKLNAPTYKEFLDKHLSIRSRNIEESTFSIKKNTEEYQ